MTATALGKYEIRGVLGRGAMGVVYRAWDPVLEREVALKTMDVAGRASADDQTVRFLREAKAAGRLHHPNIVTIHELGETESGPFIAMELMEGIDLRQLLKSGRLPQVERRLRIVADVCRGLDFAHRAGIVHRDVKPANVFLLERGGVKLLDFGVAKLASSDATRSGMLVGSVEYMSPEQVRAERDLDGRSDVFAAGVILYELLFGRTPFSGDHVGSTMMKILHQRPPGELRFAEILGPRIANILARSLAKSRDERFADAGEMARELDAAVRAMQGESGRRLGERLADAVEGDQLAAAAADDATVVDVPGPPDPPGSSAAPSSWRAPLLIGGAVILSVALLVVAWRATEPAAPTGDGAAAAFEAAAGEVPGQGAAREATTAPEAAAPTGESPATVDGRAVPGIAGSDESRDPPRDALSPDAASRTAALDSRETGGGRAAGSRNEGTPAAAGTRDARPEAATPSGATGVAHDADVSAAPPAPPRAATAAFGRVALIVTPWARVTSIRALPDGGLHDAGQVTPAVLTLPAGRYRLELAHPSSVDPVVLEATVEADAETTVRRALPSAGLLPWIEERLAEESYVLEAR